MAAFTPPIPAMMAAMPLSTRAAAVIVASWNGRHLLPSCLDALLAQDAPGWAVEIVVVDNGSTDGTAAFLADAYPQVRVIALASNLGFGAAVNRGIIETTAPFVVLVNNDAVCEPGFVAALLAPFDSPDADQLGAVTARIILADRYREASATDGGGLLGLDGRRWVPAADGVELLNSTGNEVTVSGNGRDRSWLSPVDSPAPLADVFGFCGGAAALRRSALDRVGTFDETLFLYYEDTDLSWRLRRHGWQIAYAHDAVVRHRHAASSGVDSEFFIRHNDRNRVVVALRNAPLPVVVRAVVHTAGRAARDVVRGRNVRRHLETARYLAVRLPGIWRERRGLNKAATIARRDVARYLIEDTVGA